MEAAELAVLMAVLAALAAGVVASVPIARVTRAGVANALDAGTANTVEGAGAGAGAALSGLATAAPGASTDAGLRAPLSREVGVRLMLVERAMAGRAGSSSGSAAALASAPAPMNRLLSSRSTISSGNAVKSASRIID